MKGWLLLLFLFLCGAGLSAAEPPHILFILADDLGWGDLQCYGGNGISTPGLDRLAREGLRFTQFYQGGSVCSPTRATLMTGMWPSDVKVFGHFSSHDINLKRGMPDLLDPDLPTLCELAGAPVPDGLQRRIRGQSVAPAFKGDQEFLRSRPLMWEWRYKIFNHRWNCSPMLSVRDGKWKLLFNPEGSRSELYDMERDPFEESNQALQHPDTVAHLKGITLEWQASLPESPFDSEAGAQPVKWPKAYDPAEKYLDRNLMFDKNQDGWLSRDEFYHMGQ